MKFMTGHGRGEAAQDGFKIAVEVGSVNRKQSEIAVNLTRSWRQGCGAGAAKIALQRPG